MKTYADAREFYAALLAAFRDGQGPFYKYYDQVLGYPDIYGFMRRFNTALKGMGKAQVLLHGGKSAHTYAAIYAIMLSGNVWIPLSPDNPEARTGNILRQTEPALLLHESDPPPGLLEHCRERGVRVMSYEEALALEGSDFEQPEFAGDDLAYFMFTSGSTGIPKGVPMTHDNYINFVNNVMEILPFEQGEVFSDFHDFAFDISIFYLFACPLAGGAISPIITEMDKVIPINHIQKNGVTVWSSVPSAINRIKAFRPAGKIETPIRIMFLCGEPFKLEVLKYCLENMGLENVYNFYGLTETGVENFHHRCSPDDLKRFVNYGMAPIGKPLPGNFVRIGENKELHIGGPQVTPGYLGGVHQDRVVEEDGVRWFKSGDIVERFEDVWFCKGRLDSQVKISGYRIELSDIEAQLTKLDCVDQAVVVVDDADEQLSLVGAVKAAGAFDEAAVRASLAKELPRYMIPKALIVMESFPLNQNGKVDRMKVKALYQQSRTGTP